MSTSTSHDISQLNHIVAVTLDSAKGYHDAGEVNATSRFTPMFRERAAARHHMVLDLQSEVRRLGGTPEDSGTMSATAQRWFATLKNSITGSEATVIGDVEACEDHVKAAYEEMLKDQKLSAGVRAVITTAYATIKADHDKMRDLKQDQKARADG